MNEISKLRKRLRNVGKNTVDYYMTVTEAKSLLDEIDKLLEPKIEPVKEAIKAPSRVVRILDGGTL